MTRMQEIRCPDCARSDNAAVLFTIPESVSYRMVRFEDRGRLSLYVCDLCPTCPPGRNRWCVALPEAGESRSLAA